MSSLLDIYVRAIITSSSSSSSSPSSSEPSLRRYGKSAVAYKNDERARENVCRRNCERPIDRVRLTAKLIYQAAALFRAVSLHNATPRPRSRQFTCTPVDIAPGLCRFCTSDRCTLWDLGQKYEAEGENDEESRAEEKSVHREISGVA